MAVLVILWLNACQMGKATVANVKLDIQETEHRVQVKN